MPMENMVHTFDGTKQLIKHGTLAKHRRLPLLLNALLERKRSQLNVPKLDEHNVVHYNQEHDQGNVVDIYIPGKHPDNADDEDMDDFSENITDD